MWKFSLQALIGLLMLFQHSADAQWKKISKPSIGNIVSFAACRSTIFEAFKDSLFMSTDNGVIWTASDFAPIADLGSIGASDSAIFVVCGAGISVSTNSGANWGKAEIIDTNHYAAFYPKSFAVYKNKVYGNSENNGIFLSTNYGKTWTITWTEPEFGFGYERMISKLAMNDKTLFAGANEGGRTSIIRSTDNGASWSVVIPSLGLFDIDFITVVDSVVFIGTSLGVFHSKDNGTTWTKLSNASAMHITNLVINGKTIYAGTMDGHLFQSNDTGKTWTSVNTSIVLSKNPQSLAAKNGMLFTVTVSPSEILRSVDNGITWISVNSGLPTVPFSCLKKSGDTVFGMAENGQIFQSANNGVSWSFILIYPGDCNMDWWRFPMAVNNSRIFLVSYEGYGCHAIYKIINEFGQWTENTIVLKDYPHSWRLTGPIAINGNTIFCGKTPAISSAEATSCLIFSTNNGVTWDSMTTGIPNTDHILSFATSCSDVFAASDSGLFRSVDNSARWADVTPETIEKPVTALAASYNAIFAGCKNGVFLSTDHGANWTDVNAHCTFDSIGTITVNDENIYVVSLNDSGKTDVWQRPLGEMMNIATLRPIPVSSQPTRFEILGEHTANKISVAFSLFGPEHVSAAIYSLTGRRIAALVDKTLGPGSYCFPWDARNAPAGNYAIRLQMGSGSWHRIISLAR
jgi:photosystem II stability/assembly factor-like uncharacterized protein